MKELSIVINHLLDVGNYAQAYSKVKNHLDIIESKKKSEILSYKAELYAFIIDIGIESNNKAQIEEGMYFFLENENMLLKIIDKSSYFYNLANAKSALGMLFYKDNPGVHNFRICKENFQEAIDLFWIALRNAKNNVLKHQIQINLSNALIKNSRLVEAIQMLDMVLIDNSNFPQAVVSKADHLFHMSQVCNSPSTIALHCQIHNLYKLALDKFKLPVFILQKCKNGVTQQINILKSLSYPVYEMKKDMHDTIEEYSSHTAFRKFSLDNYLTLNEHSLYCKCIESSKDNIQIGIPNVIFNGALIPKLELLLNRIKSEFALARWHFYSSQTESAFDYDVIFSDLFDNEIIDSQSETLRTSFRICYGILDKIALGICKIYNITGGAIYFEKFWDDKNRISTLLSKKNIHLNALSSIANDLNSKRGELKHFKNWRNKLEHNLLILQNSKKLNLDPLDLISDDEFVIAVDINKFRKTTLHLLQLTRAAIFSFVYCIRLETITSKKQDNVLSTIKISTK